jgi:LuxR family maltose regulon positive regulatory protein
MEDRLITTKLNIPQPKTGIVFRPRLLERLATIQNYGLTLISAPAGFGKTTLISEWIHQNRPPFPVAWLSIEESENDPARFWDYFIAAVKSVHPDIGGTALTLLHSPQTLSAPSVLTPLVNELAGISDDFFLVLDDYHFIETEPVHSGMVFLLEHLPPRLHLVIASRTDPPLPLPHYRGKNMLLEIRADDLRFNEDEAAALFTDMSGLPLSREEIRVLNDHTEGWVVGLKMAIISLRGEKNISAFISGFTGTHRYIMDYLIEEVLQRQPSEVCNFLLKTSVLERLSGPLCDAVIDANNGSEMLQVLDKANLFIVPLDNSREWYRYEHLFAGLLRHQLDREMGKQATAELQKKASRWYESNGLTESAIDLALAAHDWDKAAELILATRPIVKYGGTATYKWLSQVPQDILLTRPQLGVNYAWSLAMTGRPGAARTFLDDLEKTPSFDAGPAAGSIATLRAYAAGVMHDPLIEEHARRALSILPEGDYFRAIISLFLGIYYLGLSRYNDAEPLLAKAHELLRQAGDTGNSCLSLAMLAIVTMTRGKLHQAIEMFQKAIEISGGHPHSAVAHVHLSLVYVLRNELDTAEEEIKKAIARGPGIRDVEFFSRAYSIPVFLARGDIEGAVTALDKAEQALPKGDDISALERARLAGYHVVVARVRGDPIEESYWLDKLSEYGEDFVSGVPGSIPDIHRQQAGEGLRECLQKDYERYRQENYQLHMLSIRVDQALASADTDEALTFLAEALAISRPENIIRPLVGPGPKLVPLLRKAVAAGIEPDYTRQVLNIIETEERQGKIRKGEIPLSPAGILSEREAEVLHLIAKGFSNRQIADKLIISPHTAAAHVRHILDKLDARGRTQAVARARDLGIL